MHERGEAPASPLAAGAGAPGRPVGRPAPAQRADRSQCAQPHSVESRICRVPPAGVLMAKPSAGEARPRTAGGQQAPRPAGIGAVGGVQPPLEAPVMSDGCPDQVARRFSPTYLSSGFGRSHRRRRRLRRYHGRRFVTRLRAQLPRDGAVPWCAAVLQVGTNQSMYTLKDDMFNVHFRDVRCTLLDFK